MEVKKINLTEKFKAVDAPWKPKIIGELNEQYVKIAKLEGDFVFHQHEKEDELFLVLEGVLLMEFEDQTIELHPGELIIVPKGTPHRPRAPQEVKVVLFEPRTTLNTGDTRNAFTVEHPEKI